MGVITRIEDGGLGHLLGSRLHHDDGVFRTHHHQVQQAGLDLRVGGIRHELAADQADADGANRRQEGNIGKVQGRCAGDHPDHVRVIFRVGRKHHSDDLRLVVEAFGEQGPHRAINQAAGDDLLFGRTPLAFEEAAGNFARRVVVLAVVNRQGKEVDSFAGIRRARCRQNDGVSVADVRRSMGLLGELPAFNCQSGIT